MAQGWIDSIVSQIIMFQYSGFYVDHNWHSCEMKLMFFFQTRQPVFVRLLQGAFRLSHCTWLSGQQKYHVENCIKTLSDIGKQVLWWILHALCSQIAIFMLPAPLIILGHVLCSLGSQRTFFNSSWPLITPNRACLLDYPVSNFLSRCYWCHFNISLWVPRQGS